LFLNECRSDCVSGKTIIFFAQRPYSLESSRTELIGEFSTKNRVICVVGKGDISSLDNLAVEIVQIQSLDNRVKSISNEISAIITLKNIILSLKPDICLVYNAKPSIYYAIASFIWRLKVDLSLATVTGLGYSFTQGKMIRTFSSIVYKYLFSCFNRVVFQNQDDYNYFLERNWVCLGRAALIISSGIDVSFYQMAAFKTRTKKTIRVGLATRILWSKGVAEFSRLADEVLAVRPDVEFVLAGELAIDHPDGIPISVLESMDNVSYVGKLDGLLEFFESIDIFVFPSHYREGVPRAVIEAAGCSLPVIGLDVPGTREAIVNGVTGFLVPVSDKSQLELRTLELIDNFSLRKRFGDAGRKLVEDHFDRRVIVRKYKNLIYELI
jgi:glycosyltransferase involved in cell wall biosynthesis